MKLRHAMVDPGRALLAGLVEADEASIALRSKTDPPAGGQGRSHRGKMLLVVAAEVVSEAKTKIALGRIRLAPIADYSQKSLRAFLARNVAKGARLRTDGWSGYPGAPGLEHAPHTLGKMPAHVVLPAVHRVISNRKAWALGVYHGLRRRHLHLPRGIRLRAGNAPHPTRSALADRYPRPAGTAGRRAAER